MLKHYLKTLVLMSVFTLFLCCSIDKKTAFAAKAVYSFGSGSYTIINGKEARYEGLSEKAYTVADIPDKVELKGKSYRVTQISDNALANSSKIKRVSISENVKKIGKKAFYNCKNLKSITIKSELLKKNSVGANAFKGLPSDAVLTVPKEKLSTYKSILKSKGLKNQKVKSAAQSSTAHSDSTGSKLSENASFDLSKSMFDSDICFSKIDTGNGVYGTYTNGVSAKDSVFVKTKFSFKPGIYGYWEEDSRKLTKGYVRCGRCGRCFSDFMLALHNGMELEEGGCWGNYYIAESFKTTPTTWAFVPDETPCQAVVKYTLPDGVSYKDGSAKISIFVTNDDVTDYCKVNVSGNVVTITIDDVKKEPLYNAFDYNAYKKDLYYEPKYNGISEGYNDAFLVRLELDTDENLSSDSIISSEVSYSYKGTSNTESFKDLTIRTASVQVLNADANGNSISEAKFDLYQKRANQQDKGNLKSVDWKIFKKDISDGDIVTGLGTGFGFENQYKLVQTKTPNGYEEADDIEFVLEIKEDGTISAEDENGNALKVENGVVKVTVVNAGSSSKESSPTVSTSVSTDNAVSGNHEESSKSEPAKNNDIPENKTGILAVYFQDGIKESSMKRYEKVDSTGMIPTKSVSYRAYKFEGCHLAKITLNGEEIDSIPDKVKDGSTICFYYESN